MIVDRNITYKTIKSPKQNRRDILNLAINLIELMQQQKRIKDIRDQKHRVMLMLKDEVKNTNNLISKFEEILPQSKLKKEEHIKINKVKIKKQKQALPEEPSKLDFLQKELFDLRARLDSI